MKGRWHYLRTIGHRELTAQRVWAAAVRRVRHLPSWITWHLPGGGGRHARARLAAYRDRHAGEQCLIVANGPSVRGMDLKPAHGMVVMGMNRGYRLRETHGIDLTYLVAIDVASQIRYVAREIAAAPVSARFVNWSGRRYFRPGEEVEYLRLTFRPGFHGDVTSGIYGGHSVTYACLQLAFHMGFTKVILVGKDHSYAESGTPTTVVVATGLEDNHFVGDYYRPGEVWRIPDYKGEELAYRWAHNAFRRAGREILDATVGGRLNVFPKADFLDAIARR